jgi:hypothetical protein
MSDSFYELAQDEGDVPADIAAAVAETLIEIVALLGVDALGWIRGELEQQLPVVHVTAWWQRPLGRLGIKTTALCGERIVASEVAGLTRPCRECQRALDGER